MAERSCGHRNKGAPSQPLTEETTTAKTKRLRNKTSTPSLQQTLDPPSPPPSDQLPHIPIDLISRILVRLPVKSLLQSKSVCKSWNALISDPQFAKDQFRSGADDPTRNHLLLSYDNRSGESLLRDFSLPAVFRTSLARSSQRRFPLTEEENSSLLFAGSCHGMLLLCFNDRTDPTLWNPATGKFKTLPCLKCNVAYGFGYDHLSDSYKVVAVVWNPLDATHNPRWDIRVKIHATGTDSWREIQGFPVGVRLSCDTAKFAGGAVNWIAEDNASDSNVIASIDMATETHRQHRLPPGCGGGSESLTLAVSKGRLCILSHRRRNSGVWVMKEYGNCESWTKVFSFDYNTKFPVDRAYTTRALCLSDDDEQVLLELDMRVVVYDSKNCTFKATTGVKSFKGYIASEIYAESLISP